MEKKKPRVQDAMHEGYLGLSTIYSSSTATSESVRGWDRIFCRAEGILVGHVLKWLISKDGK